MIADPVWFVRRSVAVVVLIIACALLSSVQAQTDWRRELKARLQERYPPARLTWDGRNIKSRGAVLLLMQPNVRAERKPLWNRVRGGALQPPGKAGFFSDLARQTQDSEATADRVSLPRHQPVFLTDVGVDRDRLILFVATERQFIHESIDRDAIARFAEGTSRRGDTFTSTDASVRQAALVFELPEKALEQMSFDDVKAMVDRMVLRADDPRAPQPGVVRLGMSRDEVMTNLGKPRNVVDLGSKVILVYASIKVTLVDGKVADVQ